MSTETELVPAESREVTLTDRDLIPTMVSDVKATKARLAQLQEFVRDVMVEGEDHGIIPGTPKPTLYKPGAEKLLEVYGYSADPIILHQVEDWDRPFFYYQIKCNIVSKRTGQIVGSGLGSCNSLEARYRWRDAALVCPHCKLPAIIKGKEEYGGGWVCFKKKGGCGAKFADDAATITEQPRGKVENDDIFTLVNTIMKVAYKRALVAAALSVTRSSALFTQDLEDIDTGDRDAGRGGKKEATATTKPDAKKSTTKGTNGPITAAQVTYIEGHRERKGVSPEMLTNHLGTMGVERVEDLPASEVNALLRWIDLQATGAGAAG